MRSNQSRPASIDVAKVRAMKAEGMGGHQDWAGIGI